MSMDFDSYELEAAAAAVLFNSPTFAKASCVSLLWIALTEHERHEFLLDLRGGATAAF